MTDKLISLLGLQEPVVHRKINIHDHHLGHRRRAAALRTRLGDQLTVRGSPGVEQPPQGVVDPAFSLTSRQQEDLQVLLDRTTGTPL
jgi:hypothetical protein